MPEDHDCKTLTPIGARPTSTLQQQREKGLAALEKLKSWGLNKKHGGSSNPSTSKISRTTTNSSTDSKHSSMLSSIRPKPSTAAQKTAALNNLKITAKGDAKIPVEQRMYLWVVSLE
jgi:hypothetical protein